MSTDRRMFWGSLAVLMLLLSGYVQQERRRLGENPWNNRPGGDEFVTSYVAAKIARSSHNQQLYYVPAADDPIAGYVDPHRSFAQTARASGVANITIDFIDPPFFAIFMEPLSYLPLKTAALLWRELNTLFLVVAIFIALVHFRATPLLPTLVMAIAGGVMSFPFQEAAYLGQVGGLVLLLWTLGTWSADTKRPILAAFCFALGAVVKVTPAIVVPLFVIRRQWKWLTAYVGWMALFLTVSVWQLGWENHVTYFMKILPTMSFGDPNSRNKSLVTFMQSLYFRDVFYEQYAITSRSIPLALSLLTTIVSLAILCCVLIYFHRRNTEATHLGYELSTLAVVSLLIAPVIWRHDYVLIILPLLYLWIATKWLDFDRWKWPLLFLSTIAVATVFPAYLMPSVHNFGAQLAVSAIMPAGALLLLGIGLAEYLPATISLTPSAVDRDAALIAQ